MATGGRGCGPAEGPGPRAGRWGACGGGGAGLRGGRAPLSAPRRGVRHPGPRRPPRSPARSWSSLSGAGRGRRLLAPRVLAEATPPVGSSQTKRAVTAARGRAYAPRRKVSAGPDPLPAGLPLRPNPEPVVRGPSFHPHVGSGPGSEKAVARAPLGRVLADNRRETVSTAAGCSGAPHLLQSAPQLQTPPPGTEPREACRGASVPAPGKAWNLGPGAPEFLYLQVSAVSCRGLAGLDQVPGPYGVAEARRVSTQDSCGSGNPSTSEQT